MVNFSENFKSDVLSRYESSKNKLVITHILNQVENIFGIKNNVIWNEKKEKKVLGFSYFKSLFNWDNFLLIKILIALFSVTWFMLGLMKIGNPEVNPVYDVYMFGVSIFIYALVGSLIIIRSFYKDFQPVSDILLKAFLHINPGVKSLRASQFSLFLKNLGIRDDIELSKQKKAVENFVVWMEDYFIFINNKRGLQEIEKFKSLYSLCVNDNDCDEYDVMVSLCLIVKNAISIKDLFSSQDLISLGIDFSEDNTVVDESLEKLQALSAFNNLVEKKQ